MHTMTRTLPLFALLALGSPALAQGRGPQVLALGGQSSVTLRLPILESGLPEAGFTITRSGPGGERSFTVKPLNEAEAAAKFGVKAQDYQLALGGLAALRTASAEERGFLLLNLLSTVADSQLARALNLLVTDSGLAAGRYSYRVQAGGQTLGTVQAVVGQNVPLAAPQGLRVTPGLRQAQLGWTRGDPTVLAYRVQRAVGSGPFATLGDGPKIANLDRQPGYLDGPLDPQATYRYRVTALDAFGRESAPSAEVTLPGRLTVPLSAPLFSRVEGQQGQVLLEWPKVSDPSIKEVLLWRGDHPGKLAVLAHLPATATSYTDKNVPPAQYRYYALSISDGTRQSALSPDRAARPYNATPPAAPQGLAATGAENAISLRWTASRESDVTGYNVYRAEVGLDKPVPPTLLNGEPTLKPEYTDPLPQGVQSRYRYSVRAVNSSGVEGNPSAEVTAALLDRTPPDAPLLLRAQAGGGQVALIFTQAPTPDLKAFEVYRAGQGELTPSKIATLPPDSIGYLDRSPLPGQQNAYAVVALDTSGNASPASNVLAATPLAGVPAAPAGLRASVQKGQLTLSWQAVGSAAAYYVFRVQGGRRVQVAGPLTALQYQEPAQAGARYQLRAVNDQGQPGPFSAEVAVP